MKSHYEVEWHSTTSLGGSSRGTFGRYATAAEAAEAAREAQASHDRDRERRPLADTSYYPIEVVTDEFGNRTESVES